MPTFAQKQNQPQQKSSESLTRSNRLAPAASYEAQQTRHLQHTIGNQAALRLLRGRTDRVGAASDSEDGSTTEVRSETPTTSRFAYDFSRIPVHAPAPITIQRKLAVNTPGDTYEQEADHIAEQVMGMPEPKLQRACACGGGCSQCQMEQPSHEPARLQTKHVGSSDSGQMAAPPIVHEVLASPGQPLDASTREFFEPRFGHDFSEVRVHTDAPAAESARAVDARAYTVGSNIVFADERYASRMNDGGRLLGHELAHVVQQSSVASTVGGVTSIRHGVPVALQPSGAVGLARKPRTESDPKATPQQNAQNSRGVELVRETVRELSRVVELVRETVRELKELTPDYDLLISTRAHPDSGGRAMNGHMVEDYQMLREELRDYLTLAAYDNKAVGRLAENWSKALYETGELRRVLTSNILVHYRSTISDEQKRLRRLASDLSALERSLNRIEQATHEAEEGVAWVSRILKVNDALEVLEHSAERIDRIGSKLARGQLASESYIILEKSNLIEKGVENLANYSIQLAIVGEGYTSVAELETAIKTKVASFNDSVAELDRLVRERDKAELLYWQPVSGAAKR